MNFKKGWYLIYTKARREKKVVAEFEKKDIKFCFPTKQVLHQWNDRKRVVTTPLFPSYIFVYIDSMDCFYIAKNVQGVVCYVKVGKQIAQIDSRVVEELTFVAAAGNGIEVSEDRFTAGQYFLIKNGLFSGFRCEVIKLKNKVKVLVRINILNRIVTADLPTHLLINQ